MSDPLSVLLGLAPADGLLDKPAEASSSSSTTSPPATPSKLQQSRISSRPSAYVRPIPGRPAQSSSNSNSTPVSAANNHVEQFANGNNQQYTSIVRSQSPLAPRPPLPGQIQRPVSPIQWNQSGQAGPSTFSSQQQQQHRPAGDDGGSAAPFSPASPNAWASSPESASAFTPTATTSTRQFNHNLHAPVPSPVPVPQPVPGISGPSRSLNSPGEPRSPVAENPTRPILSNQNSHNGQGAPQSHAQQQHKAPPYVRIRVTGIDRAKKELGIKMDAQTNIPTYHRRQSPIFERTYNEFSLLHGALSANHPETILPALPLPQTSATNEEEEDRFLKGVFQKFMDRIIRDKSVVLDDELRGFVEADFGYTPLTKAKKLKSGAGGFLSRSSSKPLLGEDGEPDFLVTSKVHSAALETALADTCKSLERVLKHQITCASSYADLANSISSFSTTETHLPLTEGMKALSEAMLHVAQLETGQSNATALVLGDSLAYEAVEARSAKDALLQRQYNIDELRNSIKSTINKRRYIEKIRASGSIKPEKVNEALDDLDEAVKHEQALQHRVEAISRNLRPSLQTHLRTMNDDILSIALGQARTMLAYENRKLQIYENVHSKISKIPERGANDANVVMYHTPQAENNGTSSTTPASPAEAPESSASGHPQAHAQAPSRAPTSQAQIQAANMSPTSSHQSHGSASTANLPGAQSKFLATQAAIHAEMQAQREREERQRAQFAQARAYQHQKQASVGRGAGAGAASPSAGGALSSGVQAANATQQPTASTSGTYNAQVPVSPPRSNAQAYNNPSSPLHESGTSRQLPHPVAPHTNAGMSQSMFMPGGPSSSTNTGYRAPPLSPPRNRSVSSQSTAGQGAQGGGGIDPLAATGGSSTQSQSGLPPQSSTGTYHQSQQASGMVGNYDRHPAAASTGSHAHMNGNMTQSVFLPGRNAVRQPPPNNTADERKRADARKAANLLAGAF